MAHRSCGGAHPPHTSLARSRAWTAACWPVFYSPRVQARLKSIIIIIVPPTIIERQSQRRNCIITMEEVSSLIRKEGIQLTGEYGGVVDRGRPLGARALEAVMYLSTV